MNTYKRMRNGKIPRRAFPPGPEGTQAYLLERNLWHRADVKEKREAAMSATKAKEYVRKKKARQVKQRIQAEAKKKAKANAGWTDPTRFRHCSLHMDDIERHIRKGRDLGQIAVYTSTPVSEVAKAVEYVKALKGLE